METLKSLKTRISTVDTIMKATSAMKMVSTIKLSKINNLHKFAKDCSIYMQNVFVLLLQDALFNKILPHQHWLFPKTNCEELVVVLSPSTSFCGAFTQSITSTTKDFINKSNNINTVCCGDKIKIANAKILQLRDKNNVEEIKTKIIESIFDYIQNKNISKITVISGKYENALTQNGQLVQLLPVEYNKKTRYLKIESDPIEMLEEAFFSYINHTILWLITEHLIAEFSARIIATDNATRNAKDLSENLSILYNSTRQTKITQELIEIVSSVECMKQ